MESLPEEKEEEEGQSGSGNDRPSALEANIDECPALLALRNQRSEERGIALFPFSPPSLASSPTPSTFLLLFLLLLLHPRFFSTFNFPFSANNDDFAPFRRESREHCEQWAMIFSSRYCSFDFSTLLIPSRVFPWILMKRQSECTRCPQIIPLLASEEVVSKRFFTRTFLSLSLSLSLAAFEQFRVSLAAAGRKFGPVRQGQTGERDETRRDETRRDERRGEMRWPHARVEAGRAFLYKWFLKFSQLPVISL